MKLNVEEVMLRVRQEVARRHPGDHEGSESGIANGFLAIPAWSSVAPEVVARKEYVLGDLLEPSDRAFIDAVYRAVLCRPADTDGMRTHLAKLRSGEMSKVEIVAALRWSPEGHSNGVHVDGLLLPYLLQKWRRKRIIGPVLGWLQAFARLPALSNRIARVDVTQARETQELGHFVNRLGSQIDARFRELEQSLECARRKDREHFERLLSEAAMRDVERTAAVDVLNIRTEDVERLINEAALRDDERMAAVDVLTGRAEEVETRMTGLAKSLGDWRTDMTSTLDAAITQQSERIAVHDHALQSQKDHVEAHGVALADILRAHEARETAERALDALYVAFEEQFRGSRELIRARVLPYVEILRDAQVGTHAAPVLDIGCGRGDWLDVMREHNFVARGVDTNHVFVELCRGRGLDVIEADAVEILRGLPDGSLGGVTGLHIAEHLPFDTLVGLLDECRRVLCIGGVLVLETPNPENLQVAAHHFYTDPTHRNPLPPETLRFIIQARGFERVRIERLTEARELDAPPLLDDDLPGAGSVNFLLQQLHVAPDYAIVARRL